MTYVLARSLAQGREAGLVSALGIAVGSAIHTTAAAIGLSALLLHSEAAFTTVKIGGAAYLVWLAFKAFRDGGGTASLIGLSITPREDPSRDQYRSPGSSSLGGFTTGGMRSFL